MKKKTQLTILKSVFSLILLVLAQLLIGDLMTSKQYFGILLMIAAGCIWFKDDWEGFSK
jgi:hypothetical protein